MHQRTDRARLGRLLSGMCIAHVGDEEAKAASTMLINAVVAETALRQRHPVVVVTPDIDDMTKLRGDKVRLAAVQPQPQPATGPAGNMRTTGHGQPWLTPRRADTPAGQRFLVFFFCGGVQSPLCNWQRE